MALRNNFSVTGNFVDIPNRIIYPAQVVVENGKIAAINKLEENAPLTGYILPGFTDSHVHIESSLLIPSEFARLAVIHGTVATISDPHEIANVCGMKGVEFMIENGKTVPFKFHFGAPSCVPATIFETAGDALNSAQVKQLLERPDIWYLSEMMNFPGVLSGDEEVMKKIAAARSLGKPVDGHAPGLKGAEAKQYIEAGFGENAIGISTDHECFTAEEALDKLHYGMKILIREGSAARNFEALAGLLHDHSNHMMFCSDDKHPDSLLAGHINQLCVRAVAKGINVFKVLQAACINPVEHYNCRVGLLRIGDPADFIIVEDLQHFKVLQTYIDGELVAENGRSLLVKSETSTVKDVNQFHCGPLQITDLKINSHDYPFIDGKIPVIEALDGQLITNKLMLTPKIIGDELVSDTENDILKIVVVNRYFNAPVAKSFIRNFGFKKGAIASTVAHDSHNIVAVGADDESLLRAINDVVETKGGLSCVCHNGEQFDEVVLPLPVAGLMSDDDAYKVAGDYIALDKMAKSLGGNLSAPFMVLSFMALLVIPHLKLSDKGLFDGDSFRFV